jgi:hypothetical protein
MKIVCAVSLLLIGVASAAFAQHPTPGGASAPEIAAGSAASALALLSGALLVIRGRRK